MRSIAWQKLSKVEHSFYGTLLEVGITDPDAAFMFSRRCRWGDI